MISLESLHAFLAHHLAAISHLRFVNVACALGASYAVLHIAQVTRRRLKTTALRGPPNPSFVWGVGKVLLTSPDPGAEYEKWAEEYGGVYEIPSPLGGRRIVLCDPKAIAHVFGAEPWTVLNIFTQTGKGLTSANGEDHRRLRKSLTPAFSSAAIRNLTSVFYDSAYKAKGAWDSLIESNGGGSTLIEVENWMNHISLDTIGIAGFSHDFGSLDGNPASVTEVFDAFGKGGDTFDLFLIALAEAFPWLLKLPTPFLTLVKKLNDTMGEITNALLAKSRTEKEADTLGQREEQSILGLLIRAEEQGSQLSLTHEEVLALAKIILLGGYESTSITLTWALIELSKKNEFQNKLRAELLKFGADPTYDQLTSNLPYLDAVVHETFRMHVPLDDFPRIAVEDDVIPLSKPTRTRSGEPVDHISVAKGTYLSVSASCMNRSSTLWGPDAKEFRPERWIEQDGIPAAAREVQGHRHLLTFLDGPRTCLGKGFAITEFKIVLSVLVKHFVFELRDGPETVIERAKGILPRPKVAGEQGVVVPLRVRRVECE